MNFDPYLITSYLHQNYLIPPVSVNLTSNLRTDFGLSRIQINEFLEYLDGIFGVTFPIKKAVDNYEYMFEIVFYILITQYENNI